MTSYNEYFLLKAAYYYQGENHQEAAWRQLEDSLDPEVLETFKAAYRGHFVPSDSKFPLPVPYFYQRDSKTGHGERMCFSSSMAMAMEMINPLAIEEDDDWYLKKVFQFGDSVSSTAQLQAAHSLGFDVEFHTDGTEQDLIDQLDNYRPVPIGILHSGDIYSPTGGGHWICLIGYDDEYFYVHDPFGELDLILGGYPKSGPKDGENVRYTRKNLMKRWLIASESDGWYMKFA